MTAEFIFVGCRFGSEKFCKQEFHQNCPNLRFSYSRPGFLTFKVTDGRPDFSRINRLVFPRIAGVTLGKFRGEVSDANQWIQPWIERAEGAGNRVKQIHWWNRNLGMGDSHLKPFLWNSADPDERDLLPSIPDLDDRLGPVNGVAKIGDRVLDVIQVEEDEFWIGYHDVTAPMQRFPGGIPRFEVPEKVVSRAYYKSCESFLWARFPWKTGDCSLEIGSAPGGSVQAQLDKGLRVIGVDPAEMDPIIQEHPQFTHIRKRAAEIRKRDVSQAKWLIADSNVAPNHILDSIEGIVTHQSVNIQGMIVTLKLIQDSLVESLEEYRKRVGEWGYRFTRFRQLAFNRSEVCMAAIRRKSLLRFGRQRPKKPSLTNDELKPSSSSESSRDAQNPSGEEE